MLPGSRLSLLLLLLCTACSSVAWQPRPTAQTWRGASLWRTEQITLAAADESTAEELLSLHERLCAAFARVDVAPPPPPLLFAVGVDDELLFGDPVRTIDVLTAWQHEFVHGPAAGGAAAPPSERPRTKVPADAPPEMVRILAKILAAAVPLQAPELDLPGGWRVMSTWGLVVPTEECIEAAAEAVLDHGMAKADVGFGHRLLMAPLMPWIRGKMRTALRDAMLRQVVDAYLARAGGSQLAPAKKQGLLAALGVAVDPSGPDPELETLPRGEGSTGR